MRKCSNEHFEAFRPWFLAAGAYNLIAGSSMVLAPRLLLGLLGIADLRYIPLWQVIGMFILVYAPAYFWAARKPYTFRHLILIGLAGKVFGPLGYIYSVNQQTLPPEFGRLIIFNDLAWWPAFGWFVFKIIKNCGGWHRLLLGE